MKLKYAMEFVEIGDEKLALPVDGGEDFHFVLKINGTTEYIIHLLETSTTEEKIAVAMAEKYNATPERILTNIRKVLDELRRDNLIDEE